MEPLDRILLVDDDAVTNMMHTRVIKSSGRARTIEVATDGQEALEIIERDLAAGVALPELIFLDINMPRMGGFEFLERYGALDIATNGQLIIVMLSTSLLLADHARADADPNVHSFCEKPMRIERLMELIDEYQRLRRDRDAA
ncbi:response regulator [uncultured Sulfitobacter sp.]|uniref:response regulator n=1 Tax=uncultured Sulfitobacter sp. TaxID=191468 RepID=UPI0026211A70|nr:response regulator [uncultured Sulfitobacter sp.]